MPRLLILFLLAVPSALAAQSGKPAMRARLAETGTDTTRPLGVGDDDEFRRAMLDWAPPPSVASSPATTPGEARLYPPLERMRLSSGFGMRVDPIDGQIRYHTGIDIPDQAGAPIHAAAEGVITYSGWAGGYGNLVTIRHANGLETRYGHLSRLLTRAGQAVHQGQIVGLVGETGRATGNHLHFEVRSLGQPIDPSIVLEGRMLDPQVPRTEDALPVAVVARWTGWQDDPGQLPISAF